MCSAKSRSIRLASISSSYFIQQVQNRIQDFEQNLGFKQTMIFKSDSTLLQSSSKLLIIMFELHFDKVTLGKANRYLLIVSTQQGNKRTEISQHWTSAPEFAPLELEEITPMEVKVCEAGTDRKIRVIGIGVVGEEELQGVENSWQGQVEFKQKVEGKEVCVGIGHLRITPKIQPGSSNDLEQGLSLAEDQQGPDMNQQADDFVRLQVHCGLNFYLGSAFHVELQWGKQVYRTSEVRDRMVPLWGEGGCVSGHPSQPIQVRVCDSGQNVLQSLTFRLESMATLFPYHIRLVFKEEFMGARPELLLSLVRQSYARHSITESPLRFKVVPLGQEVKGALYMAISNKSKAELPSFTLLDRQEVVGVQHINAYLRKHGVVESDRLDMIGLVNKDLEVYFSIFKSFLNRKLYLHVISLLDPKTALFSGNPHAIKSLQTKEHFEVPLRKAYYHGQTFTIKRYLEIFNPLIARENAEVAIESGQRWKVVSRNFLLRRELVDKAKSHIAELRRAIEEKGKELVEMKKVASEVRTVNQSLELKEKLMSKVKKREGKQRQLAKGINVGELAVALIEKQAVLEGQKNLNAELAVRMGSLMSVEEDHTEVDKQVVTNAGVLLKQQEKLTKMGIMERALGKQRDIIAELERLFQKSEVDRRVNEALNDQSAKLRQLREKRQAGLRQVYGLMKENNKDSLHGQVRRAEQQLLRLNEQYARVTGL